MKKTSTLLMVSALLFSLSFNVYGAEINLEKDTKEESVEIKDVEEFIAAAEGGNVDAMYNLGLIYSSGEDGVEIDYKESFKWYLKAAKAGDSDAQLNLGILYSNGQGIAQNYIETLNWYEKSAAQGNVIAQYNLGVIYSSGKGVKVNYPEAVKWYSQAANGGDSAAKYNLGIIYFQGAKDINKDIKKSFKWISNAVDAGDMEAFDMLSQPAFYKLTAEWYREMAEFGDDNAQVKLASFYLWGNGVEKDLLKAHMWFNIASAAGNEEALTNRKSIEEKLTPEQIKQAQGLAKKWRESKDLEKNSSQ